MESFELTAAQWSLAALAAAGIGVSKSGFAGLGMFHIIVFAQLFGARASTGIILPMLVVGDVSAVAAFRRHARWEHIGRVLPPTVVGIVVGWLVMHRIDEQAFRPLIGGVVLGLTVLQVLRLARPGWFADVPHTRWFAVALGFTAGMTTMLVNGAGPIVALYLLAVGLPKYEFVGTGAWFFLIVNVLKLPLSAEQNLITWETLQLNGLLAPCVVAGLLGGRMLVRHVPQRLFDFLLLAFTAAASLRMLGAF